ncbi:2-isopropylmalate synthase [Denitromonas ohlonensis]|uniref:2-isopropylmalate synthase n=2 Tax=Denitromonas TaxID=139331 RepID=A0A557SNZ0_9RHOO|nr:2-isopropylmalate synthase [Denitromonas ohlonensis]TVO67087.1 2-isopropylmalate synthase [Denitromonas ohlonensis]TVO79147.1 2-isopropylmalate synthase [Denitromonas ohlonensis]
MLNDPSQKYPAFNSFPDGQPLRDRTWPDATLTHPPIWMSTDLRDGNQALFEPMNAERKQRMFKTLVAVGFKEIEVGFPSASQTDFDFVRALVDSGDVPDDVTIEVLTQAREPLIRRTFESVRGARRAIIHFYNATAPNFRRIVFDQDRAGVKQIAVEHARLIRELAATQPDTEFVFQYSPEVFTGTEIDFAVEVCNAVIAEWEPTPERPCIINLPATVEMSTPNIYADQIEWMSRHLDRRDAVVLSVHPHNDRGTAVAAAELAVMAGADRVEGCLFGNGERTGNVDLVTLALNLYSQGVHPGLDFSCINEIARTVEHCTQLPIHPRHPYVGDLVFTAFSGSHQDAIKKGLAVQQADAPWAVPYLPVDPADLGRSYESVIRVNSQSGKGGIAYLLEAEYGLVMPRRLQVAFSNAVQAVTDDTGREMRAEDLWAIFTETYLENADQVAYAEHHLFEHGDQQGIQLGVTRGGRQEALRGIGNGPIDAALHALAPDARLLGYEERAIGQGSDARAVAFIELQGEGAAGAVFGVGIDGSIVTASVKAIVSAVNQLEQRAGLEADVKKRA